MRRGTGSGSRRGALSIVDVGRGQLLDIVPPARDRQSDSTRWLLRRPREWRGERWARLDDPLGGAGPLGPLPRRDLSGPYRAAFNAAVPKARQVADPFHVVRLGNDALDEVRRRVQNQTLGHRGRKDDPLYRARKLLVSASENITAHGHTKLRGLLDAGDPYGEVRDAWHAKDDTLPPPLPSLPTYDHSLRQSRRSRVTSSPSSPPTSQEPGMPEAPSGSTVLGRTIATWRTQTVQLAQPPESAPAFHALIPQLSGPRSSRLDAASGLFSQIAIKSSAIEMARRAS